MKIQTASEKEGKCEKGEEQPAPSVVIQVPEVHTTGKKKIPVKEDSCGAICCDCGVQTLKVASLSVLATIFCLSIGVVAYNLFLLDYTAIFNLFRH